MEPLLQVRNLKVHYSLPNGTTVPALRGVDFEVGRGESVGVLGESGGGKSTLAAAVPRLLPPGGTIASGSVVLQGRDMGGMDERQLRAVRGSAIGFIHQEPALALNPVLRVGRQVADVVRAHSSQDGASPDEDARAALERVGLAGSDLFRAYPHQLSGGQRQRVVIAQAIVCRPDLVIADEPTSSLDSTTQAGILELLKHLRRELGMSLLLISHDPAIVANLCDRVLLMYAGRIVEQGPAREIYCQPLHPYTRGLLSLLAGGYGTGNPQFPSIPGTPPDMSELPSGCSFVPRCAERMEICTTREPEEVLRGNQRVRCFKYGG